MLRPSLAATVIMLACAGPVMAQTIMLNVEAATVMPDPMTNQPQLMITFAKGDRTALARFTSEHIGGVVEIKVNGEVLSTPVIQSPIMGGVVAVSQSFSPLATPLEDIARRLVDKKAQVEIALASDRLL